VAMETVVADRVLVDLAERAPSEREVPEKGAQAKRRPVAAAVVAARSEPAAPRRVAEGALLVPPPSEAKADWEVARAGLEGASLAEPTGNSAAMRSRLIPLVPA
jgi:hypothetical protein